MTLPRTVSKILVPLYGGTILFCKDRKSFEKVYRWLHEVDCPTDTEDNAGLTDREAVSKDGKIYYLSSVFDNQIDTVVHESGHICTIIMKRAGINSHDDDGESFCYLQEHVFNSFCAKMHPKPKKEIVEHLEGKEW